MKRLKMIWWILTKKYVSVTWKENDQERCEAGYETNAPDKLAANMACWMCMRAKTRKYHKEQFPGYSCTHFEY